MDGEQVPLAAAALEEHLAGCAACRSWLHEAERLHRLLRVRSATPVPDLTGVIMSRLPRVPAVGRLIRIALVVVGLAQLALGAAQMFGLDTGMLPDGSDAMSSHLFDEGTAWNLAAGVGLLLVAARPTVASGMVPVLGAFVVILAGFCVRDLLDGTVTVSRIASHGLLALGVVLMALVWRADRPTRRGGAVLRAEAGQLRSDAGMLGRLRGDGGAQPGSARPVVGRHRAA